MDGRDNWNRTMTLVAAMVAVIFMLLLLDILLLMRSMRVGCPDAPKEVADQLPAVLVMTKRPPVIRVNSATARIWVKEGTRNHYER